MPKRGDLGTKCLKTSDKFEISTFKIGYMRNFVKIRRSILFGPGIWLEIWKVKTIWKLQIFPNLKFWVVSGSFVTFLGRFGSFRLVLGYFGSFWLVLGFIECVNWLWKMRTFDSQKNSQSVCNYLSRQYLVSIITTQNIFF